MKLLGSLTSPYVRKVRILIHEKRLPVEVVVEDPWPAESRVPAHNPLGKVPTLVLDDGEALFDSPLVMAWLDHRFACGMVPNDPRGYWACMKWHALANGTIDAVVARVLELRRPADKRLDAVLAREEARFARALDHAEDAMTGAPWLVGTSITVADIALGVALQYADFRHPHDWRSARPRLARWHATLCARPSFRETLPPGFVPVA